MILQINEAHKYHLYAMHLGLFEIFATINGFQDQMGAFIHDHFLENFVLFRCVGSCFSHLPVDFLR